MIHQYSGKNTRKKLLILALLLPVPTLSIISTAVQADKGEKQIQNHQRQSLQSNQRKDALGQEGRKVWKWEHTRPEGVGMSSEKIDELIALHKRMKTKKLRKMSSYAWLKGVITGWSPGRMMNPLYLLWGRNRLCLIHRY